MSFFDNFYAFLEAGVALENRSVRLDITSTDNGEHRNLVALLHFLQPQ